MKNFIPVGEFVFIPEILYFKPAFLQQENNMFHFKCFAFICILGLLVGCASYPKELSDHKLIPGGEYSGKANNYRPKEIKYQKLPDNVQYVLANDDIVIEAYNKLKADLSTDDAIIQFNKALLIMPGAWARIDEVKQTGAFNKRTRTYGVGIGNETIKLRYAVPKTKKSSMNAWNVIKHEIRRPAYYTAEPGSEEANSLGEISIRSINAEEMSTIVWFNPFKIVEPTFVVNDKYLIEFDNDGNIDVIDYLPYYLQYNDKVKAYFEEYEKRKLEYEQFQQK